MALSHPLRWWAAVLAAVFVGAAVASEASPALSVAIVAVAAAVAVAFTAMLRFVTGRRKAPFLPPLQTPAVPPTFVGREEDLRKLRQALLDNHPGTVINIYGPGGIGKTSLAIALAQSVTSAFPDGQLYSPLSDTSRHAARPAFPAETMADFVYALQPQGQSVPAGAAELARRYRALTARKKVLVVLDDVADRAEVAHLIPPGPGCATLLTSRARLSAVRLDLAYELGPLSDDEAKSLLRRITKTADPFILHQLTKTCGRIPLALRLAGNALSHHPVADFGTALQRAMKVAGGTKEAQPLDPAYGFLTHEERSAFRCIAAIGERAFSPSTLAAAADVDEGVARRLADRLAGALLLERVNEEPLTESSYAAQDVVRHYAGLRAEVEDTSDVRNSRLSRLENVRARYGQVSRPADVRRQVFQLEMEGSISQALESARAALTAAQDAQDQAAKWVARAAIAELSAEAGNITEARAIAMKATAAPDISTRARSYRCLGHARRRLYQYAPAAHDLQTALALAKQANDLAEQARVLCELSIVTALAGRDDAQQAEAYCTRAEEICAQPDPASQSELGRTLTAHGRVRFIVNDLPGAELILLRARDVTAGEQQSLPLAYALYWLAQVALKSGHHPAARAHIAQAIDMFADIRHYYGLARCRKVMADLALADDDPATAAELLQEALETFHSCGDPSAEAEALQTIAGSYGRLGRWDESAEAKRNAAAIMALLRDEDDDAAPLARNLLIGPAGSLLRRIRERRAA